MDRSCAASDKRLDDFLPLQASGTEASAFGFQIGDAANGVGCRARMMTLHIDLRQSC
jgi:hypothetical protein